MKCPHCLDSIHDALNVTPLGRDAQGHWAVVRQHCPSCARFIFFLVRGRLTQGPNGWEVAHSDETRLVHPKGAKRPPPPPEVPQKYADDYREACLVIGDSAKASAALSRRCLQHLLREEAKAKHASLEKEIQEVIDRGNLPSYVVESLDAVRNIGNFAAHPIKSSSTGEVVDVEPGEAEWTLDVLELLFDFFFVQPEVIRKKRASLDKKLTEAGRPPMK